jgi:hypothetical protein
MDDEQLYCWLTKDNETCSKAEQCVGKGKKKRKEAVLEQ